MIEKTTGDFFSLVRNMNAVHAESPPAGTASRVSEEPYRLGQTPHRAFRPATIATLRRTADHLPCEILIRFAGLSGTSSPLPEALQDKICQDYMDGRSKAADFLNIFHHRFLGLLYRAWTRANPLISMEQPMVASELGWDLILGSFAGRAAAMNHEKKSSSYGDRLYFAGRIGWQQHSGEGLAAVVSDLLGCPVTVHRFICRKVSAPSSWGMRLGDKAMGLGRGILGTQVEMVNMAVQIEVEVSDLTSFRELLPDRPTFKNLAQWISLLTDGWVKGIMRVVLRNGAFPQTCLGEKGRLGWDSYTATQPLEFDDRQLVINLN